MEPGIVFVPADLQALSDHIQWYRILGDLFGSGPAFKFMQPPYPGQFHRPGMVKSVVNLLVHPVQRIGGLGAA